MNNAGFEANLNNVNLEATLNDAGFETNSNEAGLEATLNNVGLEVNLNNTDIEANWNNAGLEANLNNMGFSQYGPCIGFVTSKWEPILDENTRIRISQYSIYQRTKSRKVLKIQGDSRLPCLRSEMFLKANVRV